MNKLSLEAFKQKVEQENLCIHETLIGGTQGNCHVSGTNAGNGFSGSFGW